jgi:hypothetical protein
MIFGERGMEYVFFVIEDSEVITIALISALYLLQSPDPNYHSFLVPQVVSGL